jgi:hypothetical protein
MSQRLDYRLTLVTVNGKIPLAVSPRRLWHKLRRLVPQSAIRNLFDTLYLEYNIHI